VEPVIDKYGVLMRTVEEEDASFILALRLHEKLGRFISRTENDVAKQKDWIRQYKVRETSGEEYYFMAVDHAGNRYGTIRIYHFESDSFESGSWLFSPDAPRGMSILADLAGRDFGYETLGFPFGRFAVDKNNITVLNYLLRFRPEKTGEDAGSNYFRVSYENYQQERAKLLRMLYRNK
jgi:hypothetical protein